MHTISLPLIGATGKIEGNASPVVCSPSTLLACVPEDLTDNNTCM